MGMETMVVAALAQMTNEYVKSRKQERRAKSQKEAQDAAIAEENAKALESRKQRIDQIRSQVAGQGAGTRGVSSAGLGSSGSGSTETTLG